MKSALYAVGTVTFLVAAVAVLCTFVSPWFFLLTPVGTFAVLAGGTLLPDDWFWM